MTEVPTASAAPQFGFAELKTIFDVVGTMFIATDADGIVRIFNPAAERLLGWRADEVIGKQSSTIWHVSAEVAAGAMEFSRTHQRTALPGQSDFQASCLTGSGQPSEWTLVRNDGSAISVQLSLSAIRDTAGRVTGYIGSAQDLTDRVQAEQERDSFFDLSLDMLCIAHADGYFKRVNPAFTRTLGWSELEFLARPFMEFIHPEDQASTQREVERQVATGRPLLHFENRYQHKDGSWRVLSWMSAYQSDGFAYATARDVTDAKRAEEALRRSEQNLAITLDAIGDAVITTDAARRVVRMNPVAEQMTGWTHSEAVGRPIGEVFQIIDEQTRQRGFIPANDVLESGVIQCLANHTVLISRDGTEWPIADSAAPIRDATGKIAGVVLIFRDVAEERSLEQTIQQLNADLERRVQERTVELAESEERLTLAVDVGEFGIWDVDLRTGHANWNEYVFRQLGYTPATDGSATLEMWNSLILPSDLPRVLEEMARARQARSRFTLEHRLRRADNQQIRWNSVSGSFFFDEHGQAIRLLGVSHDITDRMQTEQALRLLSTDLTMLRGAAFFDAVVSRLSELLNCEMAFICRRDPAQPELLVTLALFADGDIQPNFSYPVAGTPCELVVDRRSYVIASDASQKFPADAFLTDQRIEAYVGVPFIDGQGRQVGHIGVMSRRPLTQPESVEAIAKLFAVSVVAEIERQASERRFSDLFEFSPDAIVITNGDGVIVEANRHVETVFGWTPAELVGQLVEMLIPTNLREGHPRLREQYMQSELPRAMGSERSDLLGLRKDGSVFPVEISLSPMQTSEGLLVAAAVRDVTERQKVFKALRLATEELQAANAVIEQETSYLGERVADRTAELTRANEELVRASKVKSEFLATMSHELRTPLNGVLGMNGLLLKTPLSDKQREFVEASNTSGRALLSLINDVLDISKIEAGKIELDLHGSDLEALAYDVFGMFTHRAKEKGLALTCRLEPETCVTAMCDDTRLRQILVNLLGNALKFTTAGGVVLETKCLYREEHRIVIRFAITDTGMGIPDDKLYRLFAPFSQIDSSTSRQFGGTGLGLSIVKRLVELMGGTIGVSSDAGVGSTFWFEVPFDLVNAEQKTAQRKQLLDGTKVLVVDRMDSDRRQIADCLKDWGCRLESVVTLREAIETVTQAKMEGQPFAVVLADCRLAIGDEFGHLQKLARRPELPVIGLGFSESNDMANLLHQLGLRHLLSDPIRPSALFNALSSVLYLTTRNLKPDASAEKPPTSFSGHVLVAEDNHINQMFVRELLKHCSCTCDIANNGKEALTALQNNRYDLVLMDCQMPEMDGFAATREIRCREAAGELAGHLPIVALTANALKSDRERCLEAGMDDYLSKPLQTAQLQSMLAKHLAPRAAQPAL